MENKESLNIYEFIKKKLENITAEIAEILLEGDAYFSEWEAISKLLYEIEKFLDILKRK